MIGVIIFFFLWWVLGAEHGQVFNCVLFAAFLLSILSLAFK